MNSPPFLKGVSVWFGHLPGEWRLLRLRHACSSVTDGSHFSPKPADEGFPYVTVRDLVGRVVAVDSAAKISGDDFRRLERDGCRPRKGDVLFSKDGSVGKVVVVTRDDFVVLSSLAILSPQPFVEPSFLAYCLESAPGLAQLESGYAGAALRRLTLDAIVDLHVPIPTFDVQASIAGFLDWKTAEIDALIAKKERLLRLLDEKRTALVSEVIANGARASNGAHERWRVLRNKVLFLEVDERTERSDEVLLTVSHITGVTKRSEKEVTMMEAETTEGYKRCRAGDVAVNTMWAFMGAIGVSPHDGIVSPSYNVYRPRGQALIGTYYDLLCRTPSYVAQIGGLSKGIWRSRLRLYPDAFFELRTPVPSVKEQQAIVERVSRMDAVDAPLRSTLERSVRTLREYRSALITAAVTGQIEVPAW